MALRFLGRVGVEHFIGEDGKDAQRPQQQFKGGTMAFSEDVPEVPAVGDTPAVPETTRGLILRASDVGKTVAPTECWHDEDAVMAKYPGTFEKVDHA